MLSEEQTIRDFSGGDDILELPAKVMARRMLFGDLPPQDENFETQNHGLMDWFWKLFGGNK